MKGQYQAVRWIECLNTSGYVIPKHSLVTVTGSTLEDPGRTVLRVSRAEADHAYPIAITNHAPIAIGDYGLCACEGPVFVTYNDAATPVVGYAWGTASDSFKATKDKNGLLILGGLDATRKLVLVDIVRWEAYQPVIRFQLAEALADTDEQCTGTISLQIGPGRPSPYTGAGAVILHNLPRDDGGYEYWGDAGHYGTAAWGFGNEYWLTSLQCPP